MKGDNKGNNRAALEPLASGPALCPKIVRLDASMHTFAESPRDLVILDENGKALLAGDHDSAPSGGRTWLRSLKVKPL